MRKDFFRQCVFSYIAGKRKLILLLALFAIIFMGIFGLYDIRYDAVIYAAMLCCMAGIIIMIVDFVKFCHKHDTLERMRESVLFSIDELPVSGEIIEKDYQQLISILFESQKRIINESAAEKSFLSDYYAMWVHQIKVPIAAMHLLMKDKEKNSPLALELFKIEQYVEMALSYVRLKSDYTDYIIKEYDLGTMVKQAVRKYAPLFIAKKIALNIKNIDTKVITDEKWLQFVIEQVLSNSLKYTKKGSISIYMESTKTLVIEDTGIGIAPEDIKRIGEKGFTGYNGRQDRKSTGLGLYLCGEILSRLSHHFEITSEVGKGTQVRLHLDTVNIRME